MSLKEKLQRGAEAKAALIAENERLKSLLSLDAPTTIDSFGAFAPQAVRDKMAAAAYIQSRLDIRRALILLGFDIKNENGEYPVHNTKKVSDLARSVFGTPGCQAILDEIVRTEVEPTYEALIIRLKQTALADDDKNSNSAAATLAKLMGLNKEKAVTVVDARSQNLFLIGQKAADKSSLMGGPQELSASDFLTHEPGEPERIFEVAEGT